MFVREGACKALMKDERQAFLQEQWPEIVATINRLNLDLDDLLARARKQLDDMEDTK
jgi:GntR family transcriptional regulator